MEVSYIHNMLEKSPLRSLDSTSIFSTKTGFRANLEWLENLSSNMLFQAQRLNSGAIQITRSILPRTSKHSQVCEALACALFVNTVSTGVWAHGDYAKIVPTSKGIVMLGRR